MNQNSKNQQDEQLPGTLDEALVPFQTIRTETVLSKLPVHNLSKKGTIQITVTRVKPDGAVSLFWEVSHNSKVGQPGQLAYKLDTLIVNRRIEEERNKVRQESKDGEHRSLPRRIRLGSINEIGRMLGQAKGGKGAEKIRLALQQNAATFIKAKLAYKATDGTERWLDAFFNRYNVIFTGERLPDGSTADAVYLILSDPYWEVLNSAPYRPLDYDYLRELSPGPQRFYEVVSYRIYAALENGYPVAKITYSEYCTFSAQMRYYDYDHVKKQMYKIHVPHIKSGYIAKASYEPATDEEGKPDWIMSYVPGPKAEAEYRSFSRKVPKRKIARSAEAPADPNPISGNTGQATSNDLSEEAGRFVDEIVSHGVSADWAHKHVRRLDDPGIVRARHVLDYWIAISPKKRWDNPAGMLRRLLEIQAAEGLAIPAQYPSRKAGAAAAEQIGSEADRVNDEARRFVEEQRAFEARVDASMAAMRPEELERLRVEALTLCRSFNNFSNWTLDAQNRQVNWEARKIVARRFGDSE